MHRFEQRRMLAQRRRGLQSHRAGDARGLIGQDVSKGILRHDDIKEPWLRQHAHGSIVDKHIVGGYLRILRLHLFGNLPPQTTRSQHVGLVNHRQVLTSRHRHLEGHLQDALNLRTRIDVRIECLVVILIFLAKIHAARQLADDHEVCATKQFLLQRRLVQQTVERSHRAHIGIEAQLFAHSQQSRFRTHLQRGIIVVLQVAHRRKQHGISPHAYVVGSSGISVATRLDGAGTHQCLLVFKLVSALLGYSVHHGHTLFHNLRPDTITRQNSNL